MKLANFGSDWLVKILAIGKKHDVWIADGVKRFEKRCRPPWNPTWELLPPSHQNGGSARQDESGRILARLKRDDFVILLDERGKLLDSPALSATVETTFARGRSPVFVIGGAYGVDDKLMARADLVWSISPLVFPHQLVRLILAEQIYRAQEISHNRPYHHE